MHHGVRITDAAIVAAAVLSDRYITDRFLPDKAIDLVDEAASRLRIEIDSMPAELDEIERRRMQLQIEREALRKENDAALEGAPRGAREGAGRPRGAGRRLTQRWEAEKGAIAAMRAIQERARGSGAAASSRPSARATDATGGRAQVRHARRSSRSASPRQEAELAKLQGSGSLLKEEVTADDIAEIVGRVDRHPGQPARWRARPRSCCTWKSASTSA